MIDLGVFGLETQEEAEARRRREAAFALQAEPDPVQDVFASARQQVRDHETFSTAIGQAPDPYGQAAATLTQQATAWDGLDAFAAQAQATAPDAPNPYAAAAARVQEAWQPASDDYGGLMADSRTIPRPPPPPSPAPNPTPPAAPPPPPPAGPGAGTGTPATAQAPVQLDAYGFPIGAAATSAALDPRGLRTGAAPPALPPALPEAPGSAGQDGAARQDDGGERQPVPPLVHGAGALLRGMVQPPPTAAQEFAGHLAGGLRAGTAGVEGTGLPEPVRRFVRAAGPRAADVVEGLGSPNPGERGLALLGAAAPPVAGALHALGVPDRPLLPGVQRDTPVLGGLTNPTEVISGAVGPLEAAGALRYATRGAGRAAARGARNLAGAGSALGEFGERLARETPGLAPAAGVVPPEVARRTPTPLRLPEQGSLEQMVLDLSPYTRRTPDGYEVQLSRAQDEAVAGAPTALRGVVHYSVGPPNPIYVGGTRGYEGGAQLISGATVVRAPLLTPLDGDLGTGALEALAGPGEGRRMVGEVVAALLGHPTEPAPVAATLRRLGVGNADEAAAALVAYVRPGTGRGADKAVAELLGGDLARRRGYDAVIGYGSDGRLGEFMDLREGTYPTPEGGYSLRPEFRPPEAADASAAGVVSDAGRYYHGTGRAFDRPDPATFDPGGLYGPAYYLTDEPRLAAAYAGTRSGSQAAYAQRLEDTIANERRNLDAEWAQSPEMQARLRETLRDLEARRDALLAAGANVRPVDVPAGLRLLDVDSPDPITDDVAAVGDQLVAALAPAQRGAFLRRLADIRGRKEPGAPLMGADLYDAASVAAGGDKTATNRLLAAGGFDGIRYSGGQRIPLRDDAGRPIQHTALAIFPESLSKVRNALSGEPGGIAWRLPAAARTDLLAGTATGTATGEANRREAAERGAGPLEQAGAFGAGFALGFPGGPAATRLGRAARGAASDPAGIIADVTGAPTADPSGRLLSRAARLRAGGQVVVPPPRLSKAGQATRQALIEANVRQGAALDAATAQVDRYIQGLHQAGAIPATHLLAPEQRGLLLRANDTLGSYGRLNLLWSPITHLRNVVGTAPALGYSAAEALVAPVIEPLARAAGKTGTRADPRYAGEAGQLARGTWHALGAAGTNFWDVLRHGDPQLTAQQTGRAPQGRLERALDVGFRPLTAADAFFKTLAEGGALYQLAYRTARARGHRGAALEAEAARLVRQPSDAMVRAVEQAGRYATYTGELDKVGKGLEFVGNIPGMQVLLPFIRTPYNAAKYDLERSPLGALAVGKALLDKDATSGEVADRAARALIGGATAAALFKYALDGNVTGAPPDSPAERDAWEQEGKKPFSIRLGDSWYDFRIVPGLNASLVVAAELAQRVRGREADPDRAWQDDAGRFALEVTDALVQRPLLDNLAGLMRTIDEPQRAESFFSRLGGSAAGMALPASSALRYATAITDPVQREPRTVEERVRAGIPGLSGDVPARRTAFGDELPRTQTGGEAAVNPIRRSAARPGVRRFTGSRTAAEDTAAAAAIERVRRWNRRPDEWPRPSARDFALADRFGGTENPDWRDRRALEAQRGRREEVARAAR